MSLEQELLNSKLRDSSGKINPKIVHTWAKNHPKSELHKHLTWDDRIAGYRFRIHQIERIIDLTIGMASSEPQVCNLVFDRKKGGGYRPLSEVLSNQQLYNMLLEDALADLRRVQNKYKMIKELQSVWNTVDRVDRTRSGKSTQRKTRLPQEGVSA